MTRTQNNSNRLIDEKSPYLLQHAHNPVDWYAWNEDAFIKARTEDKPIFLSIGYSTCHWCHVMAHESFEDEEVAYLMNETFVNIKVDREERPDIDKAYMQVAQMMTGRGGWPLSIIMTPEKEPFFAGTYIAKKSRYGQLGIIELIQKISQLWKLDRANVNDVVSRIRESLNRETIPTASVELNIELIGRAADAFASRFDDTYGGFGSAPKFPSPHNLMMLLRYWRRSQDEMSLHMVEKTLKEMRRGGMFDHIGFGFHRYSTDRRWLVPHFEKMLYDQAMMMLIYTEAFHATRNEMYATTSQEIAEYVLENLRHPDGGFFSAEDADSEGVEGKFYVWSYEELSANLDKDEMRIFTEVFNIKQDGNYDDEATGEKTGKNIPYRTNSDHALSKSLSLQESELQSSLNRMRLKLLDARSRRVRPHLDDKILSDWNGLMIGALAYAGRVLNQQHLIAAAEEAYQFIHEHMLADDRRLFHRYREGERGIDGFLDDYAFLTFGLIELYEATFNPEYLKTAIQLHLEIFQRFWSSEEGGYYFTEHIGEKLLIRQRESYDGAIPSGNSIAAYNGIRLARLIGKTEYEDTASKTIDSFAHALIASPIGHSMMLVALELAAGDSYEVVIAGEKSDNQINEMLRELNSLYIPSMVVLLKRGQKESQLLSRLAPYTKHYDKYDGKTTAHVCINHNCKLPTNSTEKMLRLLEQRPN